MRGNVSDSDVVRLLDAGADQMLPAQAPDEVLAAYAWRDLTLGKQRRSSSPASAYAPAYATPRMFS